MNALAKIETEAPYNERFTFEIVPMDSDKGKASEAKYNWEETGHGLVVLAPDGTVVAKFPGHAYADTAREDILAVLDKMLAK